MKNEAMKAIYEATRANIRKIEKSTKLESVLLNRSGFADKATSTGCLVLDQLLGGGIPPGRIIGLAGPEKSGKSLLVTQIAYNALLAGSVVVQFDAEGTTDPIFLSSRGINFNRFKGKTDKSGNLKPGEIDQIVMYQPTTGEQVRDFMYKLMETLPENRDCDIPPIVFILDSVMALIMDKVVGDLDSNKMAMHARMYSEMLPIINTQLVRTGCSFIYTNQLRLKPGEKFGNPEYEPCGEALKYFSAIRLLLKFQKPKILRNDISTNPDHPFISGLTKGAHKAGGVWEEPHNLENKNLLDRYVHTNIYTVKNKIFTPFQYCWMRVNFQNGTDVGYGIDPVFDSFTFLLQNKLIRAAIPRGEGKAKEKKADVEGMYEFTDELFSVQQEMRKVEETSSEFEVAFPFKDFGLEDRFTYWEYKEAILNHRVEVIDYLRDNFIKNNRVFTKAKDDAETPEEGEVVETDMPEVQEIALES